MLNGDCRNDRRKDRRLGYIMWPAGREGGREIEREEGSKTSEGILPVALYLTH